MSDVNAALGATPRGVRPRSPLADWAGIVVEGSLGLEGREVGTFGALGVILELAQWVPQPFPRAAARGGPTQAGVLPPLVAAQSSAGYRGSATRC